MNGDYISTTVIRQRGQLTLPKKLRTENSWLAEGMVVAVLSSVQKEVKIIPYKVSSKKTDWKDIWEKIKLSRTFLGQRGNLSQFVVEDRSAH